MADPPYTLSLYLISGLVEQTEFTTLRAAIKQANHAPLQHAHGTLAQVANALGRPLHTRINREGRLAIPSTLEEKQIIARTATRRLPDDVPDIYERFSP